MVKLAAARANRELGLLPRHIADAIVQACDEIVQGKLHAQFVVDMIQGGAGTSTNMNANEVIANRALEILGHEKGEYDVLPSEQPCQSRRNPPTTPIRPRCISPSFAATRRLVEVLRKLGDVLPPQGGRVRPCHQDGPNPAAGRRADDARAGRSRRMPSTLSEEIDRLEQNAALFLEVNMGGTAIGTGINADPEYPARVVAHLREITGLDVSPAPDLIEATSGYRRVCHVFVGDQASRGQALEDLQRSASAVVGPAGRFRTKSICPDATGIVHHARQGQSRDSRSGQPDRLQGNRQRPDRDPRGRGGAARIERDRTGDRAQSIFESIEMLKNGMDDLDVSVYRRHHGQRRRVAATGHRQHRHCHGAESGARLRHLLGAGARGAASRIGASTTSCSNATCSAATNWTGSCRPRRWCGRGNCSGAAYDGAAAQEPRVC